MTALPIEPLLPQLRERLASHHAVVLEAPPGAGKTTLVPLALLDEPWLAGQRIVMLEPRRLAARAAAGRMAALRGESVGGTVGYRVRFDNRVSKGTRVEVVTEGILTRRLQSDPMLEGVGLVIFDEFHERHLHSDLALALCLDAQEGVRPDLKLLVMSATLDGKAVASLLGGAPLLTSAGRSHPVAVHYRPAPDSGGRDIATAVAATIGTALAEHQGDLLAFLPGAGEIRRTEELLAARADQGLTIHPLYGDLPLAEQDRAIRPDPEGRRKVVLATPIAESSLTIEGVRVVVDSGWERRPEFDPGSGLTRLTSARISKASADQRAGRAGRLGPGVCYRLWSEAAHAGLTAHTPPEIGRADLAALALELANWGVADPAKLRWLTPPPAGAYAQAGELLTLLGALDEAGRITPVGREMAALPLHPRLSHMLRGALSLGLGALACDAAALLEERDVLGAGRASEDFATRVEALRAFRSEGQRGARRFGAEPALCARVERAAARWRRLTGVPDGTEADLDRLGLLLALAYPDRIAVRRAVGQSSYLLSGGRGARLKSPALTKHRLLVAPSVDAGQGEGIIHLASPVNEDDLRARLAERIAQRTELGWDEAERAVRAERVECIGAVVLSRTPDPQVSGDGVRQTLIDGIRRLGLDILPWDEDLRQWQARVLSLRTWLPDEDWPDVSDERLVATLEQWLGPYLDGMSRASHLSRLDLGAVLAAQLPWKARQRLEEGAPRQLAVPSGARRALHYRSGEAPVLAVKLQEMFGLADTPRIAWGRVAVTLHLLSPAGRPIQVTQDLRGFWERTYAEVRKELKGRYPKHPWPDDPWSATPTAAAKRRPARS